MVKDKEKVKKTSERRKSSKPKLSVAKSIPTGRPKDSGSSRDNVTIRSGLRVQEISLFEVYWNREKAFGDWINLVVSQFGIIPDELIVGKDTYNLIFVYLCGKGQIASGNWMGLDLTISYDCRLKGDEAVLLDWETGLEIVYEGGCAPIFFNEEDILRQNKRTQKHNETGCDEKIIGGMF